MLATKYSGSGAAFNMLKESHERALSCSMLLQVENKKESNTNTREESGVSQLVNYIQKETVNR